MGIGLAFFHGWGLSAGFWQPLATELAQALPSHAQTFFDAGYFGVEQAPDWNLASQWIGVGHSMGLIHALEAPPPQGWSGLVSIGGFTRFCAPAPSPQSEPGQPGQARRVVERMVRVFEREPQTVLRDFLNRCGLLDQLPALNSNWRLDRLAHDLARLIDVDASALLAAQTVPLLALAAEDDEIVSPELSRATFAAYPRTAWAWHAQDGHVCGHALGHARAQACAQSVQAFLQSL